MQSEFGPYFSFFIVSARDLHSGFVFLWRAATKIQCVWRGYRTRKALAGHLKGEQAAKVIQAAWYV
jgi:hypothetical protein